MKEAGNTLTQRGGLIHEGREFLGFNIYYPGIRDELNAEELITWHAKVADEDNEWPRKDITIGDDHEIWRITLGCENDPPSADRVN